MKPPNAAQPSWTVQHLLRLHENELGADHAMSYWTIPWSMLKRGYHIEMKAAQPKDQDCIHVQLRRSRRHPDGEAEAAPKCQPWPDLVVGDRSCRRTTLGIVRFMPRLLEPIVFTNQIDVPMAASTGHYLAGLYFLSAFPPRRHLLNSSFLCFSVLSLSPNYMVKTTDNIALLDNSYTCLSLSY